MLELHDLSSADFDACLVALDRLVTRFHADLEIHTGTHPTHGEVTLVRGPSSGGVMIGEGVRFL